MKKFLLLTISALVLALSSCKETVPEPTVKAVAGEATENSLSFTVTPTNAESGAYLCVEGSQEISSAEDILAQGIKFDVSKESTQTVSNLRKGTEYTIMVAVSAGPHKVAATPFKMKTQGGPPTITIEEGTASGSSLSFVANTTNATKAAYVIFTEGEAPAAEEIIAQGTEFNVGENVTVTVTELTAATEYIIVAAATDGETTVASEALEMTTTNGQTEGGITEVTGRRWHKYNYGLNIHNNEGCYAFINMYLDAPGPGGVIPEGTYPVMSYDGEYDGAGEPITPAASSFIWDMGSLMTFDDQYYNTGNYTSPASGYIKVSHLSNGYKLEIDLTDTDGYNMKGVYEGVVGYTFEQEGFSNPPIPWNETTIEGNLTSVTGSNFGNEGGFYLWMKTEQGPYDIFMILRNPVVYDGLIPEGTYTVGNFDPENPDLLVIDGSEEQSQAQLESDHRRYLVDGGTMTVTHVTGGYNLVLNFENELKTKFNITWEGAITDHWGDGEFMNPEGPAKPEIEWEYMDCQYFNDQQYILAGKGTQGSEVVEFLFELYCPSSLYKILPKAEYTFGGTEYYFTGSYVNNSAVTSGLVKVDHLQKGYDLYIQVTTENGNTYKLSYEGVIADYENSGFQNPPVPGAEENNCTVFGAAGSYGSTSYTLVFKEGNKEKLNLNVNCPWSVCNIIPEGEYPVDTKVSWDTPSQYDYYVNANNSYAGSKSLTSGLLVVSHLEDGGYTITFEGTDNGGNTYDYNYTGVMEPTDNWSTINNPPIPWKDITVNTEVLALTGDHTTPEKEFRLTVMLGDYPYDMYLVLEAPETVQDGLIPEGTYTVGGEYGIGANSWVNDGEWEVGFTGNSSVTITHLDEGYGVELALETQLKTKINATRNGLIFKTQGAQYDFQNPGYEYEPYYDIVMTQGASAGTITTYNTGVELKRYVFQSAAGDYMEMAFYKESAEPYLQEGTYTPGDEFDPRYPFGPFTFWGNGCPLTIVGSGQSYPYYMSNGTIQVDIDDNNNYTVVMKSYAWIGDGNKLIRVTYQGDLEGISTGEPSNPGTGDGDPYADYQDTYMQVAMHWNSTSSMVVLMASDDSFVYQLNLLHSSSDALPAGIYDIDDADGDELGLESTSQLTNMSNYYSSKPVSGQLEVQVDNSGNYNLYLNIVNDLGENIKAKYSGPITWN